MRLFLLTALVMMAFAGNSLINRLAVGGGLMDPLSFASWRVLGGAAVLAGLVALRRMRSGGSLWPQGAGRATGVAGLVVYLLGFSYAYTQLPTGAGALILFGLVQITMFIGAVIGAEPVPPARWIGAATAFAGLILLLAPGTDAALDLPATLSMAAAGVGWGIYSLSGRAQADALGATAANFLLAVPILWVVLLVAPGDPTPLTRYGLGLALLSGILTSGLGYALWYQILPALGAARAAVAQLTVPLIAATAGLVLLAEPLDARFVLATCLVLGGVALALLTPKAKA